MSTPLTIQDRVDRCMTAVSKIFDHTTAIQVCNQAVLGSRGITRKQPNHSSRQNRTGKQKRHQNHKPQSIHNRRNRASYAKNSN